jgi:choline dehydrogenase-like flavoprotein
LSSPFIEKLPGELKRATDVMLVLGATVTRIVSAPSGDWVREVHWQTLSGRRGQVRSDIFVLAAGGIENARLLLSSDGLGRPKRSSSGWLGRGFMEHPVDASLRLISPTEAQSPDPAFFAPHELEGGTLGMGRLGFSEALQREERLPSASIRLIPEDAVTESREVTSVLSRGAAKFSHVRHRIARAAGRLGYAPKRPGPHTHRILIDLEQFPHFGNRIELSNMTDRLGCPRVRLYWSWGGPDEEGRTRILEVAKRELMRSGMGSVHSDPDRSFNPNSHHHMGATRMHANPDGGVVNQDLRVHGMENLFVVGSSVFPTSGFANPSLTSVALALRLADRLTQRPRKLHVDPPPARVNS